jgi:hypothetical protein
MRGQLICGHDVLLQRCRVSRIHRFTVEHVYRDISVHIDWVGLALPVEVKPAAESTDSWFFGLMQDSVRPDRQDPIRHSSLRRFAEPRFIPRGLERLASTRQ